MADMKTEDLTFEGRALEIKRLDELVVTLKAQLHDTQTVSLAMTASNERLIQKHDDMERVAQELHDRACRYFDELRSHHQKQRRGLWCEVIMEHGSNPDRNAQIADLYLKEFDERFPCPSLSYQSSQPTSSQPTTNEQPEKQPTTSQPELDPATLKINEASR